MMPIYLYYFLKESSGIKSHWHEYVPLKASHFKTEVICEVLRNYWFAIAEEQLIVSVQDETLNAQNIGGYIEHYFPVFIFE